MNFAVIVKYYVFTMKLAVYHTRFCCQYHGIYVSIDTLPEINSRFLLNLCIHDTVPFDVIRH